MAPRALLLLLLLLSPLLRGSAGRPAPLRAPRHSDGIFTSELSRLRENAQLLRLILELVGKRSERDAENSTSSTRSAGEAVDVPLFVLWSQSPLLYGWLRDPLNEVWSPGLHLGLESAVPAETQRRS